MENKKLIIGFVWTFILAILAVETILGAGISFIGYMILFFIALGSTVAVETLIPDNKQDRNELQNELKNLKSRLDELTKSPS